MDIIDKCSNSQIQLFQNIIGIMRWTVKLGQIDVSCEISVLSHYLAQQSTSHLVQKFRILKYLDQHKNNELAFDSPYQNVENSVLVQARIKAMKENVH